MYIYIYLAVTICIHICLRRLRNLIDKLTFTNPQLVNIRNTLPDIKA